MIATTFMVAISVSPLQQRFIPTSELVRVASMAAHDEGFDVNGPGVYLDELRTADGKEPIKGYSSIALYKNDRIIRSYSIRVATGDIVDATECKIFRYPDLLCFKKMVLVRFKANEAGPEVIASEVGCDRLEIIPHDSQGRKGK